jgi:hypothetical protein
MPLPWQQFNWIFTQKSGKDVQNVRFIKSRFMGFYLMSVPEGHVLITNTSVMCPDCFRPWEIRFEIAVSVSINDTLSVIPFDPGSTTLDRDN